MTIVVKSRIVLLIKCFIIMCPIRPKFFSGVYRKNRWGMRQKLVGYAPKIGRVRTENLAGYAAKIGEVRPKISAGYAPKFSRVRPKKLVGYGPKI